MKHQTQLCRQIKEALMLSIPVDLTLDLMDVVPGNSGSHYYVIFQPINPKVKFDVEDGYKQLETLRDDFYDEIEASINRRRVPDLSFKIMPQIDWEKIRNS